MTKGLLLSVAGFCLVSFKLLAQDPYRPDSLDALSDHVIHLPWLGLSDRQHFSFPGAVALDASYDWMETNQGYDFLSASGADSSAGATARSENHSEGGSQQVISGTFSKTQKDSSKEVVTTQKRGVFDYVHGEVGFLIGGSTGKYSSDVESAYFITDMGNDKFNIEVGGFFENSNQRIPRIH